MQIKRSILIIFLSFLVTFAICIDLNTNLNNSFNGNHVILIGIFALLYFAISKLLFINFSRIDLFSFGLAFLFALMETVGFSADTYLDLRFVFTFMSFIKFIGFFILFYCIIKKIFIEIDKLKQNSKNKIKNTIINNKKKLFFASCLLIFFSWLPYLLNYYPGVMTSDSLVQSSMALGLRNITNHFPFIHTLMIRAAFNLGKLFNADSIQFYVFIYSIIQMIIMSVIFSASVYYIALKIPNRYFIIVSLLFYSFFPVHAIYSITMWKDVLYAGTILLLTIQLFEFSRNKAFLISKVNITTLLITSLSICLLRNNGIYVIISLLIFIILNKALNNKTIIYIMSMVIIVNTIMSGPMLKILNIEPGKTAEALSVPLQQIARVVHFKEEELSEDIKNTIGLYLPIDELSDLYNPKVSDPVKATFNNEYFNTNKTDFIKLWFSLLVKYPKEYMESFIDNSYGYWYPETSYWVVERTIAPNDDMKIRQEPIIHLQFVETLGNLIDKRDIPLLSMLFSIGFNFWIVLLLLTYNIYKKNYESIIVFVPTFSNWITILASPVFAEYRYTYSIVTCLPVLFLTIYRLDNRDKGEISSLA